MTKKAPSKNTKCPCGSGKKYRKCHGMKQRLLAKVKQHFKKKEDERKSYLAHHGHARPPMSVMMGDKRMIVIGGSIYKQTQAGAHS